MDTEKISDGIRGYRLMDELVKRLEVAVNGGVAKSTVYAAFSTGPTTPTRKTIFRVAEALLIQHEATIQQAIAAN